MREDETTQDPLTHRTILAIALPVMLSNMSTPLIGVVDTAVVGQISDPAYIGAVALGSLVFTFLFWAFGFLRMGTTGLTAQALGSLDIDELVAGLSRALIIAVSTGAGLILLQWPIGQVAFLLLDGSPQVEQLAHDYFDIRIWAAPATLINFALLGWFIGLGRTDIGLVLQLVLNLTNMTLDALFVIGFGWNVNGVAFGTLLAEVLSAVVGLTIAAHHLRGLGGTWRMERLFIPEQLQRTISVNRDIMIRSLALVFVFAFFISQGARQGNVILAANAVLMHFISVGAYFLDGLAFAAEALVGRAVGASHRASLKTAARMTTLWSVGFAAGISLVLTLFGTVFIDAMTVDVASRATARIYLPWASMAPLLGVWAFQLDGIFIGATRTIDMRNAMLTSLAIFLVAWWLLTPYDNHGLWAALYIHYLARIGTLAYYYPRLVRSVK